MRHNQWPYIAIPVQFDVILSNPAYALNVCFHHRIMFEAVSYDSINTLNMYLYRGSIPAADVAVKMAAALNTTTEYLITGKDLSTPSSQSGTKDDWQKKEIIRIINSLSSSQLKSFLDIARAYKTGVISDT